jgi:hypothetical protein
MLRTLLAASALGAAIIAVPAMATDTAATAPAAAPAPKTAFSVDETDIGTLLDKLLPGLSTNPQIDMARAMTLKQVQGYAPDKIKDDQLVKVDAELAKIPAK